MAKNNNTHTKTETALNDLNEFALSTFAVTVLRFGIRLLNNILFTRILGPSAKGIFGLLTAIPDLIVSFGNLGFGLGNTYLATKKRYDLKKIVGNTLLVTLLLGLLLTAICYFVLSYKGILKDDNRAVQTFSTLVILSVSFILLEKFGSDLLIATKQIHFMNLLRLVFSGLPAILLVLFWLLSGKALGSAMYAWIITIIVVGAWSFLKIISKEVLPLEISVQYLKESFSFGFRGCISILANAVTRRIDFLFIASLSGAQALGYYTVSVSVAEILLSVPDAFGRPFLPIHFELDDKDSREFAPVVIRSILFIMGIFCIAAAISGKLIILILFGKDFLPAYSSMLLLLPGVIGLSVYQILKVDLYGRDMPGFVSWCSVVAMTINIGLNFLLIPFYGINGAAISSSLSYGLATTILLVKFVHVTGNSYKEVLLVKKEDVVNMLKRLNLKKHE